MSQGKPAMSDRVTVRTNQSLPLRVAISACLVAWGWASIAFVGSAHGQLTAPRLGDALPVFLPAPRELMRELDRAAKDIQEKQYVDAITRLHFILNGDITDPDGSSEDYFLPARKGKPRTSIKHEADQLIASLPEEGREAYELAYGTDAAKRLEQAVAQRDFEAIEEISRRFGNTNAGEEAAFILGQRRMLDGNPLEAMLHFRRLEASQHAVLRFGKELQIWQAVALQLAGRSDQAKEVLADVQLDNASPLSEKLPAPNFKSLLAAIRPVVGTESTLYEWPIFGGNAARNGGTHAGMPMRSVAWEAPNVIGDPEAFKSLSDLAKSKRNTGAVPAVHPLLVGDLVLARTTEHLIGASMKHELLREWAYPWPRDRTERATNEHEMSEARREARMKERVWDNSLYGQVASDGELVFLVSSIPDSLRVRSNTQDLTNTLVALELPSQGKLKWIVGKDDINHEPALRGMFFLGAPLPLGDSLFCVGERNSEVRLMELDKSTGKLLWSQQLAHIEPLSRYTRHDLRRLAGINLAYSDGILICPTSTGGTIGIELSQKRFLWGHEYEVKSVQQFRRQRLPTSTGSWRDNWAVIDDGRVVLSPWDSDELFCLDLLTGENLWKRKVTRGSGLYVAGVHNHQVIIVGKSDVTALGIENGNATWKRSLSGSPAGRGIKTASHYLLATTEPELIKIDLDTGKIVESIPTVEPLGNLIASQDMIISQNSLWLRAFYQQEKLQQKVDRRLADNPRDPWALEHQGYLLLDQGQLKTGLQKLRQAIAEYPALETRGLDYLAKKRLVDETFQLLLSQEGREALELADEVRPYVPKSRESEFYRVMTMLNLKEGRITEAFETNLSLFIESLDDSSRMLVDPQMMDFADRRIRPDRWHRAMFRSIWQAADSAQRVQLQQQLTSRLEKVAADTTRASLIEATQDYPAMQLGFLDLLEEKLDAKGKTPYVEGPLYRLSQSDQAEVAGRATAMLAKLYQNSGQMLAASAQYTRLRDEFAGVSVEAGKTGATVFAAALADNKSLKPYLDGSNGESLGWGFGVVQAKNGPVEETRPRGGVINYGRSTNSLGGYRSVGTEHGQLWTSGMHWVLQQSPGAQLEILDPMGQSIVAFGTMFSNSGRGRRPKLRTFGHLVVGAYDNSLVALNGLRNGTDSVVTELWRDVRAATSGAAVSSVRELKAGQLGLSRLVEYGQSGRSPVSLGSVSDRGVVFRRSGDLVCVDPATGETLWQRDDLRVEAEVWGDDEFVFAHVDERHGGGNARVFSVMDGSELESRPTPGQANRIRTYGRYVLTWKKDVGHVFDRDIDPIREVGDILKPKPGNPTEEGRLFGPKPKVGVKNLFEFRDLFNRTRRFEWSRSYGDQARACWVSHTDLAIFDPADGKFEIISVLDGKSLVLSTIETRLPRVDSLTVKKQAGLYIVTLGQNSDGKVNADIQYKSPVSVEPLQNLEVYAYSSNSEMVWGVPARLSNFLQLETHADGVPLALFARMHEVDARRSKREFETVAIDVRDGHLAFQDTGLFQGDNKFKLTGRQGEPQVELTLPSRNGKWMLTFTDEPRAPTLPYGYATNQSATRRGLGLLFKQWTTPGRATADPTQRDLP